MTMGVRAFDRRSLSIEPLEPRVLLSADLTGTIDVRNAPEPLVPGDKLSASIIVTNHGDQPAVGKIAVNLYASASGALDDEAILLRPFTDQAISLLPGQSRTFSATVTLTSALAPDDYYLLADIDPTHAIADGNPADNLIMTDGTGTVVYKFGTFDGRRNVKLVMTDPDYGTVATLSLSGPGWGELNDTEGDGTVVLTDTTAASSFTVVVKGGQGFVQAGSVVVNGSLKSISAAAVDIMGDITVTGTLGSAKLRDVADDHTIRIEGAGVPLSFTAHAVTDLVLECASPIKSITVANWASSPGAPEDANLIVAPSIGSLTVKGDKKAPLPGDFCASMQLSGAATGLTLGSAKIAGAITGGAWWVLGAGGAISAASTAGDWSASFSGDLKSLTTTADASGGLAARSIASLTVKGSLTDAHILAGADFGADGRLGGDDADADTFGPGSLKSIKITGGVAGAIIGAGLDPVDDVFNNAGDTTVGGAASAIKSLTVGGSLDAASRFFAAAFPKKVKIGGASVDPLADPRLVAGLADIELSRGSANPGSTLTVTGSGFVPDAATDVVFIYESGDALRLRAIPGSVTESQVEVIVPPFFDAEAFAFTSGTVSVGLDQGTNVLYTPVDGFEINALGDTGEPAGSVLLETFDLLRDQAQAAAVQWQVIEAASNGTVKSEAVVAALQGMRTELAAQRDRIEPLVAGRVASIHLGKVNGRDVVLDSGSLALMDQLLVTCFLGDDAPAPSGGGAAPMLLGPEPMGGTDTMAEYRDKFNPDLATTFGEIFEKFGEVAGYGKAGVHGGIFAAGVFGQMGISGAAAVSGVASAGLYWFTVVTPALVNEIAMCWASPFIELELGREFTMADYQPGLDYLKQGSVDYLGSQLEGAAIKSKALKFDKDEASILNLYRKSMESGLKALNPDVPSSAAALAFKAGPAIYDKLSGAIDAVRNATGASRTQALRAIRDSMNGNPNGDLVLSDANARANELIGAAEPGVLVSPTGGLVTSEDGGTDTFTVVLTGKPSANVTISLASSDTSEGTVSAAKLTFTPDNWDVEQTVTVRGVNDSAIDGDQDYTIYTGSTVSSDPYYSGLPVDDVGATNLDDDAPAAPVILTIDDVSVTEGDSGTTQAVFTISLSAASPRTVTVHYQTSSVDATAGSDYVATSGTATIPAGSLSQTIAVTINGDTDFEYDEMFRVELSNPTNAELDRWCGYGTIVNDDADPNGATVTIDSAYATNLHDGSFRITFSGTASGPVDSVLTFRPNLFMTFGWDVTISGWTPDDYDRGTREDGDPAETSFTCSFCFYASSGYVYEGADAWVSRYTYLIGGDSTGPLLCA